MRLESQDNRWDQDYAEGRWGFLDERDEQVRLATIAALIACYAPGEVLDLGCGCGHLIGWLRPGSVTRYVGVDVSPLALDRTPAAPFNVERIASTLEAFTPRSRPSVVVCSEVLYYLAEPAAELARLAGASSPPPAVIVSMVAPNERKPKWQKVTEPIWRSIDSLGWERRHSVRVQNHVGDAVAWDIVFYAP